MCWSVWIVAVVCLLLPSGGLGQTHTGLFLSHRGTPIDGDGFVNAGDIGVNDDALLCRTDATDCCAGSNRMGDWYLPNGTVVGSFGDNGGNVNNDFFSRSRGQSVVRLNRYNNPSERGRFSCELRGDTIYVNILTIGPVSGISPSTPTVTAGETVNLTCSVDITPDPLPASLSTPIFEWFFDQNFNSPLTSTTNTNSGSTYTSTLQLTSMSEGGMYTCRLRGNRGTEASTMVTVEPGPTTAPPTTAPPTPVVSVSITTNTAGETYSLKCDVTVTGSTRTPSITWLNGSVEITTDSSRRVSATSSDGDNGYSSTLTFDPLSTSHAGTYTCSASLTSGEMGSDSEVVNVQIPPPTVSITSNPPGIVTVGTTVILTCTVVVDSSVDAPVTVTVNTMWNGPAGVALSPTDPVEVSSRRYTSTVMVSSFGRDQSGDYTCTATVSSASPFITDSMSSSSTRRFTVGVYLSLRGMVRPNNSVIMITDIGQTSTMTDVNTGLQCITDRMPCCRSSPTGEWNFPGDGGLVPVQSEATTFFRNRGDDGTVNLNRVSDTVVMPTGQYCCEVPDATGVNQMACAIISVVSIEVTASGTPALGQSYTLTCTAIGTTITSYQWRKDGTLLSETGPTLTFSSLRLSDAGQYSCGNGTLSSNDLTVTLPVPNPSSVTVTSNTPSPVRVGSNVMVTCTVELGPAVVDSELSLLMVDTKLSRDGSPLSLTVPTITGTTLAYTIQFNSFERSDSGNYTCTATVTPQPSSTYLTGSGEMSGTARITTGVYLSLGSGNNTNILITDIGEGDEALLCYTDLAQCCRGDEMSSRMALGWWFYPNRSSIDSGGFGGDFYRNRDSSLVRLNRRNNATSPVGQFCCVVPDATFTNVTVCANLVLELPTTTAPPSTTGDTGTGQQGGEGGVNAGVVAGVIVIVIVLIAVVVIIIVVLLVVRRRGSDKHSFTPPTRTGPVAYTKSSNGEKLSGLGSRNALQIQKFPSDTTAVEGEGVYFKVKVSGVPQPTVTWYHNGEPVKADYAREIESDGSLAIPSTELKHSGVYKAVVANQHGSEEREVKLTVNVEGGATATTIVGDVVSTRPIPIPEFGQYVASLHANSNQPYRDLFQSLDTGEAGHSTDYAVDPERKLYNRFGNIVVYNDNRISLQPLSDYPDCQEDYINACYVDGYSVPNKFIATQGPLPKTVVHFWQLIWQERPPTIVMVTNVKEGNRIKCQQYWPDSGKKDFGPFQVIITDQQVFADYTIRTLSVSLESGRSHKVTQYHFTAWPDHGVPDYATPILAFHRRVKSQHHPSRGPMIVHCSAGVGRTGTFIVIDHILEQIEKEQLVDIPGAITKIRHKRMKMVQSVEQFTFIHDAILESVTCGDTQIAATNLRVAISKMNKTDRLSQLNAFQTQFKILEQVSTKPEEVKCNQALSFPKRNRGSSYLPADRWRVILKGEQPDYIHAVNINGYKQQKAFIIAQGPMDSTARNFWKMIYDRKCAVVVMVSDLVESGEESSTRYWPSSGVFTYGEYTVDLIGEEPLEGFTIRDFSVMEGKSGKPHKVTQFHITCWSRDGRCSNLKSITDVIEEMTKVQIRSGNRPIVVHCNDTATRSGMFCAIATTIERCKTEGVVDVFQVVKALRVQKPGAVPSVDNYKLVFDAALVFLESFDTYANFQNI